MSTCNSTGKATHSLIRQLHCLKEVISDPISHYARGALAVISLFLLVALPGRSVQAQSTCTGEQYLLVADYPVGATSGSLHIFDFPYTGSMVNSPTYSTNGCSPGFSTNSSEGVTVDAVHKKVYIATTGGSEISVYTSNGLQGTINLPSDYALGIAVDPAGNNLYVAAQKGLYKYDVSTGIPTTYTSFASNSSLGLTTDYLWGVGVSPTNGNVYVTTGWNPTDFLNGGAINSTTRILSLNPATLSVNSTLANQTKFPDLFVGVTVDSDGSLWVVNNNSIEHRDGGTGNLIGSSISTSAPAATAGAPDSPLWAIALGPDNDVYVGSGATTACVYQINPTTSSASVYIPYDNSQTSLQRAKGLAFLCSDITCPAVCSLTATATPTTCNPTTNQYSVSGTISLTNTSGGIATITDGTQSTTVSVGASATSVAYSLTGLTSGTGSHTVVVSLPGCGTATAAYTAPATCTIAAVCSISATAQATCNSNGTLDTTTDDYITFVLTPYNAVQASRFTVTAMQAGNSIPLTLSDGSSFTALSYAYPTPFRTAIGTAGKGNITLTITDVNNATCTTQVTVADPGTCAAIACVGSTPVSVTYTYQTPFQTTELTDVPLLLSKFDDGGGKRTLTGVVLTYKVAEATNFLFENAAVNPQTFKATVNGDAFISLNGAQIADALLPNTTTGFVTLPAGVTVTAQGTYPGDAPYGSGSNVSTLEGMSSWLNPLQEDIYIDPRLDPRWVTTATGDPTTDDDIYVWAPQSFTASGSNSYSAVADLAQFTGSGNISLLANTLNGFSISGGGGNIIAAQRTKAFAWATVVYTYSCTACDVAATATPTACNSATNQYTVNGTISLTNTSGGTATVTDGTQSTTISVGASATSVAYSLTGLASGTGSHTVVASLPGCGTATTTYSAPASCTVAPCGLALTLTPGLCQSATNSYVLSGTLTTTNVPTSGTLTISSGAFSPRSLTLLGGNASGTFSYSGLVSDGQVYTVTATYSDGACSPVSNTYTAPASCSVAPVCSISAVATAGICASATNTYSATVVVSLSNAPAETITVSLPSATPISQTLAANTGTFTAIINGLVSDGASHLATISLPGCGTTTASFTAPASCSVAPVCSLSAVATAGLCQTATNTYASTVVVTVTNPTAGTLSVSDGGQTLTFSTTANAQNTFTATFNGLISDGTTHTVTASLPGCSTNTTTYAAPASCSIAPVCSISAVVTAGICASATNTYSATAVVRLSNPTAGVLTVSTGSQSLTFATTAVSSATYVGIFNGLISDGSSHTITASLPGCSSTTATYTAPASCSVAPACDLSVTASGSNCNPVTNLYVLSGTIAITNSPESQTLTLTDGSYVRSLTTAAGTTSIAFSYTTLQSDGAIHTVTVTSSATACGAASTTYTAPASCSVAPVCSVSAVATPGLCASATNTFSNTVTVTMNNPTAGTLVVSDGVASLTFAVAASNGTTTAKAVFNGLISNGSLHTVTAILSGCSSTTTTYSAPTSCSIAPVCSISAATTAGICASATNTYSATAVIQLTNPTAGVLTVSTAGQSLTFATTTANSATVIAAFNGLISDGGTHTITASLPGCSTATSTYTAPASCTIAAPALAVVVGSPVCNGATNNYSATATVSLSNVVAGSTLTLTDEGALIGSQTLTAGQTTASFSVTGASDATLHTVVATLTGGISASATYSAPASCTYTCPAPVHVCKGSQYAVELSTTSGLGTYQWYRNGVAIQGATASSYTATQAGSYSVVANGEVIGQCPDGSCCPTVIVEDSVAVYQAVAQKPSCNTATNTTNATGAIVISNWTLSIGDTTHYFYQVSVGSSFNSAQIIAGGSSAPVPENGILVANLPNPASVAGQSYTIRITNGLGCYRDETVLLGQTVCNCPPTSCVPLVIRRVK